MAVGLDTQLAALVALRAAGVRRVRLHPDGALHSAEFFPPDAIGPLAPVVSSAAGTLPPPGDESADDDDGLFDACSHKPGRRKPKPSHDESEG